MWFDTQDQLMYVQYLYCMVPPRWPSGKLCTSWPATDLGLIPVIAVNLSPGPVTPVDTPVATTPSAWCGLWDWFVRCQYTMSGWDWKLDLQLLSQCDSVQLSEQTRLWDTPACCWDVKQPANNSTIFTLFIKHMLCDRLYNVHIVHDTRALWQDTTIFTSFITHLLCDKNPQYSRCSLYICFVTRLHNIHFVHNTFALWQDSTIFTLFITHLLCDKNPQYSRCSYIFAL